ncbi:rho GTPase-activating protein 44-like [Uloborus diversus]|uniref:rho GTPase-activating protein 44-like n=1 Tax=Uloborus diversus TaxID=327109 RepID=UPI00240A7CF3|nr:rho GTPase-activating protein 44-like [Uloborus diversus]
MKKQFFRVKQIADQTFLRAEKTEVLTEDLVTAEKRVETIRVSCQNTQKKIASCQIDFGSETSTEKRLRKIPQVSLGASMLENGNSFSKNSLLGDTLRECAQVQTKLGNELLEYYNDIERTILKPISAVLENDIHNISKLRKQLGKLVLDMDSARTRFQTAERHSLQGTSNASLNTMGKIDQLKDELEDASQRVEQCRDALATEMFSLISKEPQLAHILIQFHQLQASYHRNALAALEASLPILETHMSDYPQKPVYGGSLDEHLRVTNRQIAQVIETCVLFLLEYGVSEEGLLRIAGSASKLKKLKSAFDAGIEIDMTEFLRDPHAVAGALKSYLRELPEPLMTFSLYDDWMNAARVQDFDGRLQALWQVLYRLPESNFRNLQYVIKFLSKILENVDVNKMSSQNIAIVMAPNLIWPLLESNSASFGMNMSTASLHTTIIDMLITYSDYFFPETEIPFPMKGSSVVSNMNETSVSDFTDDSLSSDTEINGNNLQVAGTVKDPSCSPRTNRCIKKPAAPPPPAQKSACDKIPTEAAVPVEELINFSAETSDFIEVEEPNLNKVTTVHSKEKIDKNVVVMRRRSNENISGGELGLVSRPEKPIVPDKPASYSSCSLDRRSQRLSRGIHPDKIPECMSRSHIERPTVPPPERPKKPPSISNTDNLSLNETRPALHKNNDDDISFVSQSLLPAIDKTNKIEPPQDNSNLVPSLNAVKAQTSPPAIPCSRSSTKINRFDFLVNQNTDKPPERPPRSTCPPAENDRTWDVESKSEIMQTVSNIHLEKIAPMTSESSSHSVGPPVCPRPEVEKAKPPRPLPPAKPKLNLANENTNL